MNILFHSKEASEKYKVLYHKPSWKNGWRVIVTRRMLEDFSILPITRFHQNTFKDFDTGSIIFYPIGIAQLVALKRWVWFKLYIWLKDLGEQQRWHERAIRQAALEEGRRSRDSEIEQAKKAEFTRGRNFEFKTINSHLEAMYRASTKDDIRLLIDAFKLALTTLHDRDVSAKV